MVTFIAVVALLVFATMPVIAREFARRKVRREPRIEVAGGAAVDSPAAPHEAPVMSGGTKRAS
jgi:hypothetical protein